MNKIKVIAFLMLLILAFSSIQYFSNLVIWRPVAMIELPSTSYRLLEGSGNFLFTREGGNIQIISIANPLDPVLLPTYQSLFSFIDELYVIDNQLYLLGYYKENDILYGGIEIVTISEEKLLIHHSHFVQPKMRANTLFQKNDHLYLTVGDGYQSFWYILNVNDNLRAIEILEKRRGLGKSLLVNELAYTRVDDRNQIINFDNPLNPIRIKQNPSSLISSLIALDSGQALGLNGNEQLYYIDLNTFEIVSDHFFQLWAARDFEMDGHYLYVADTNAIRVIDVNKEDNWIFNEITRYDGYQIVSVKIVKDYVYVIDDSAKPGLYVFPRIEE